jgi:hypothetical protein
MVKLESNTYATTVGKKPKTLLQANLLKWLKTKRELSSRFD